MNRPGSIARETDRPDIESFYHLAGCDLAGKACQGTASLIRSIEGRRPQLMTRPPYPTAQGGAADHALGFSQSRGTKVVSLNSLFVRPGLYEIDFGMTVRQIVEELGGGLREGKIQGVIIGGPLAGLSRRIFLIPLSVSKNCTPSARAWGTAG